MRKKRILMVGEYNIAKSGFGLYTREILSRLHKTGKYHIAELSCFNDGSSLPIVPWKVYPNAADPNDKNMIKGYNADSSNVFGKWRFDQVLLDFKPDIVFDIRDFWMIEFEGISLLRPYFHWLIAPTVDSLPQQLNWLQTFSTADTVCAHTDWAVDHMRDDVGHNIPAATSVSDSVDTDVFRPIEYSNNVNRAQHFVPDDAWIVGSVMRNQKRKLIPNLMGIVRDLRAVTNSTRPHLLLHTSYPEKQGWDIPSLLLEYNAYNYTLFTYYCQVCHKPHVGYFKGEKTNCPFCGDKSAVFPNVVKGLTDAQLNKIYNLMNVYVQYAICEGLGIPQLEAASAGIPLISVDYSAMSEVSTYLNADKVSYALFKEMETGAFRAIPNDKECVGILYRRFMQGDYEAKKAKETIRKNIIASYSWDKTAKKYEELFDNIKPKNMWDQPLSCNPQYPVQQNQSNRELVENIIKYVIQSPFLLRTTYIQNMIRFLDEGYTWNGGNIVPYTIEMAKKNLEGLLNHKVLLENLRSGAAKDNSPFLKHGQ